MITQGVAATEHVVHSERNDENYKVVHNSPSNVPGLTTALSKLKNLDCVLNVIQEALAMREQLAVQEQAELARKWESGEKDQTIDLESRRISQAAHMLKAFDELRRSTPVLDEATINKLVEEYFPKDRKYGLGVILDELDRIICSDPAHNSDGLTGLANKLEAEWKSYWKREIYCGALLPFFVYLLLRIVLHLRCISLRISIISAQTIGKLAEK